MRRYRLPHPALACITISLSSLTAAATEIQAADLHVPADYATIQLAVDAAAEFGDRVVVAAGTYPEDVAIVAKDLSIDGVDATSTFVDGVHWSSSSGDSYCGGGLSGLDVGTVTADGVLGDVTLTNCRLMGLVDVTTSDEVHLMVQNCTFEGGPVELMHDGGLALAPVEVLDSSVIGTDLIVVSGIQAVVDRCEVTNGSIVVTGESVKVRDNVVTNGRIFVDVNTQGAQVDRNTVTTEGTGIEVTFRSDADVRVRDNVVHAGLIGIDAYADGFDYAYLQLSGNAVFGCETGIAARAASPYVSDNLVARCGTGLAYRFWNPGSGFVGNTVADCAGAAIAPIEPFTAEGLRIARNNVARNGVGITLPTNDGTELECNNSWDNAAGNWIGIGDPTGLDGNISVDPEFCVYPVDGYGLRRGSPCTPGNHPDGSDCGLIGARGVSCPVAVSVLDALRLNVSPNPFRGAVSIDLGQVPEVGSAQVEVFDVRGRLVRSLDVVAVGDSGARASWDGKDGTGRRVSGGIYFAAVRSAGRTDIARLILIE